MLDRLRFVPIRLIQSVPVVFGVTVVVFFMVHLLPGNPALAILGQTATPARVAALSHQLGLDKPLWDQYLRFLGNLLQGNLGTSITYQRPVAELVVEAVPITMSLLAFALVLSLVISVPLAAMAASAPGRARDLAVRVFTLVGQGMPQFWVGIMLILLLAVNAGAFPVGGYGETTLEHWYYLFLPALTLAIAMCPTIIR